MSKVFVLCNNRNKNHGEFSMLYVFFFQGVSFGETFCRFHQYDPLFEVQCTYSKFAAAFRKWKSYKQHRARFHPENHQQVLDANN